MKSRAIVQTAPRALEMREFELPDIDADSALLDIEACGICGSDAEQYEGTLPVRMPVIPGHEPLGRISKIGDRAAERWGVDVGDRVAVESLRPCGKCANCSIGRPQLCRGHGGAFGHGYTPVDMAPALWGAYADVMYLDACSRVHRIDPELPAGLAVLFNPMGAGIRWAVEIPKTGPGDTVLVLGPGQRGLASVVAAKRAGADRVIVSGLERDRPKLELARQFGADLAVDIDNEDLREAVRQATDGHGADVVVEVTSNATEPVAEALHLAADGARVVLAGVKGFKDVPGFTSDLVVVKELQLMGAFGVTSNAYAGAIELVEAEHAALAPMHTHEFPLEEAEQAIEALRDGSSIHSCLVPGA